MMYILDEPWSTSIFFSSGLENPDLRLFDNTIGLDSFSSYGPDGRTHIAFRKRQGYGIAGSDKRYITWECECLLWVPREYRYVPAWGCSFCSTESTLCISCPSGRVLLFLFDSIMLSDILPAVEPVDM